MYPDSNSDGGLDGGSSDGGGLIGGLISLASAGAQAYSTVKKADGVATPPQSTLAQKTFVPPTWLPWAIGAAIVTVLGIVAFVFLRKKP